MDSSTEEQRYLEQLSAAKVKTQHCMNCERLTAENARLDAECERWVKSCKLAQDQAMTNGQVAMDAQAENARLRGLIEPTEANVERVARALCRCDCESNPDEMLGPIPGDNRKYVWELYIDEATAALNELDRI